MRRQVKPDDHSEVVPLLPIPNRTVKRLCADDSADSRVKVGHCQANTGETGPIQLNRARFLLCRTLFSTPGVLMQELTCLLNPP